MKKQVYFISGIDTDVGKTVATAYLANRLIAEGKNVITQKFIQTGCEGVSEDIQAHRRLMNMDLLDIDMDGTTCPIVLSYPASPHLASRIDNLSIDLNLVKESTRKLKEKYDVVLLEGAGGIMVPVTTNYLTVDYIEEEKIPLIFVTSAKLGSINHTLLALEVCKQRNIEVVMLIYNLFPEEKMQIMEDTRLFLKHYLSQNYPDTSWLELPNILCTAKSEAQL